MKFIDANVMYIFIVNVIKVLSHGLLIQIISFKKVNIMYRFYYKYN